MRTRKALYNTAASLALQAITIICGFIVPRLIIGSFGSSVNGLVYSIKQFLGYITLLEFGVGGVVRAALYKPLADHDLNSINGIVKATENLFRVIALVFVGYSLLVAGLFPFLVGNEFEWLFTFILVLIIGAGTFVQYYFGITYQVLLQADQKRYIASLTQILATVCSTILVVILVKQGAGIHMVMLGSAVVFITRPILLSIYVRSKYKITSRCTADQRAIKQRWDGLGHHLAYFLHRHTDVVVLTLFTNTREVSVYSIYYMVVSGIEKIMTTFSSGLEAGFGNMIAKKETVALNANFRLYEFISFTVTTIFFTSAALLVLPFVSVYTGGITDANYHRPAFAYILIMAEAVYCIRLPYHSVTLAAGHFKQTRNGAFAEAAINIILSIALVIQYGLMGVAIATLCAMLFRTIQYAIYLSNNVLHRSIRLFIKRCAVNILAAAAIVLLAQLLPAMHIDSYLRWCLYACEIMFVATTVTLGINGIFYARDLKNIAAVARRLL
ncbi:lipopolysaccharide biosynthesis protein [Desulfallas thermosapovorans]|uniref:O-antigen/teichoic acid export membrane protein n=1 Tax=Desulfallas thermosapovorans DSM 6562 TaxID=1121431 RepID=A0A5S4ZWH7_9FIRM|nr:polysaccharide biosynthesis C-terminal domain-containing protein [Desulfallas thermosapovorans]TYO96453.1 O-antigen/teichoic acid export membrane protein [Desulfallas thermosapovorans DSM 6562]